MVRFILLLSLYSERHKITPKETYSIQHPQAQLPHDPSKPTLAILGSGWGATSLLTSLDSSNYNIVVVSPRNYFLFTPLLPR